MSTAIETAETSFKLAPFNPSSEQIQKKCCELLIDRALGDNNNSNSNSNNSESKEGGPVLFDLGCGDARLLINSAKLYPQLKCIGIELDNAFVTRAIEQIQTLPRDLQDRLYVHEGDALKDQIYQESTCPVANLTFIDDASILYLFVLPKGIEKLIPLLISVVEKRKLQKRNFRILSYMFQIPEWDPSVVDRSSKGSCPIYLYEFLYEE
ncbi:unnamed protein product [Cylindrotheca closterium]|uniref:tRNA (guanine(46)-N(7))-methyltransferase n=1 Tax=Cylindrotheca closterium TaxID=2856 RepID=A0AAD2GCA7_9STRA|nr:unnamed protein product [Cylindrotheca closterium]